VVAAATVMFLAVAHWGFSDAFVDDSYIMFRYSRNLISGFGLVWNPGQAPVEGFTSPLWVLLLALGSGVSHASIPSVARLLGMAFGVCGLILSWIAARLAIPAEFRSYSIAAPLMLSACPLFCRHATSGLETELVAALLILVTLLWALDGVRGSRSTLPWLTLVSFLAFLARPDALLPCVVGTTCICLFRSGSLRANVQRLAIRYLLPLFALLLCYAAIKEAYFGSIIPLPAYMKIGALRIYTNPRLLRWVVAEQLYFMVFAAPLLLVALIPSLTTSSSTQPVMWATLAAAIAFLIYLQFVLPVMAIDSRFHFPLIGPFAVVAGIGVAISVQSMSRPYTYAPPWIVAVIVLLIVVASEFGMFTTVRRSVQLEQVRYNAAIGKTLASFSGITVAGSESGASAYFSGKPWLDLSGLNEPYIARNRFRPGLTAAHFRDHLFKLGLPDVISMRYRNTNTLAWLISQTSPDTMSLP
jgi:arabinofuranosyltransferase